MADYTKDIEQAFKSLRDNLQNIGKSKPVTRRPIRSVRPATNGQVTPPRGFPKVGEAVRDYLTEDEVHRMANLATSERDRLFILTLFYSALRKVECLSLKPTNLLVDESHLKLIQPKTKQSHVVGLPRWLMGQLQDYVTANRIPKDKPIFDITPFDAWQLIKKYGRKINRKIYPHLFRHSRAISLAKAGLIESEVSRALGHASDKTVKTYFRFLSAEEVADKVVDMNEGLDQVNRQFVVKQRNNNKPP